MSDNVLVLRTRALSANHKSTSSAESSVSFREPSAAMTCWRARIRRVSTVLTSRPPRPWSSQSVTACATV